jgi:transposase
MIGYALGNPLAITLSGAEQADITQAQPLIDAAPIVQAVIADKGYDSDALVHAIEQAGADAVIPPRSNRRCPRAFDTSRYRARHVIENLF